MQKIRISELEKCEDFAGLYTIGYSETAEETEGGESVTTRRSVRVSLEDVGGAAGEARTAAALARAEASNANSAAANANAAAEGAESAAQSATDAAANATTAADSANQEAKSAESAAQTASDAAASANGAAQSANEAAQTASASAAGADSAATNANAAAEAAYEAIEALGDIASIEPITDEEIDELLKDFNFLDSFTVTAHGEEPLTLEAENSAGGAEITGSVDIEGIPSDEVSRIFNG